MALMALAIWTSQLQAEESQLKLEILPRRLHANDTYPAHVVLARTGPEDAIAWLDRSAATQFSIDDESIAQFENGMVVAVGVGETTLHVQYGSEHASAPVIVSRATSQPIAFEREIESSLTKLGCNSGTCHGSLHGKGGFRLSLRGQDPGSDYHAIAMDMGSRRIDWLEPVGSLVMAKPSGQLPHGGGLKMRSDSVHYRAVNAWLAQGAKGPTDHSSRTIQNLELIPSHAWIASPQREQQVVAIAHWSDGTADDVTQWVRLECSSVQGASVSESGLVRASQPIDTTISAFYIGAHASSRLVFLPESTLDSPQPLVSFDPVADSLDNPIDTLVAKRLGRLGIPSKQMAAPELSVRRLYLQTLGRLPSVDEQALFLQRDPETRWEETIDRLLADEQYAAMWAMRWSDLLRNEPKVMSERGVALLHTWIRNAYAEDLGVDSIVSQWITSIGSTYDHPAASFHRTHRDPTVAAEAIGQVFLGVRMQCAKCHNHPFDVWTQDDYYGLAAFFSTLERQQIDNRPKDKLDTHVITGDEIISLANKPAALLHPGRSKWIAAKRIGESVTIVDSPSPSTELPPNPLDALAHWITRDNRQFARNIANRIWSQSMGRGIVDPPDDFRGSNPPSNPELLEYLTDAFIEHGYSTRWLTRQILRSQTFQRQGIAKEESDPQNETAIANFAGFPIRRMGAEVLQDAIADVTGTTLQFKTHSQAANDELTDPIRARAVLFPSITRRNIFLKAFGKPDRLIDCECERSSDLSLRQSLLLVNDQSIRDQIKDDDGSVLRFSKLEDPRGGVSELYRMALCREPSTQEWQAIDPMLSDPSHRRQAFEDIAWAIINSKEFLFIR